MPRFISGRELSRRLYWEVVRPALDRRFLGLPHAAALLGYGSDVLGFDTEMSTDHDWGPRVLIFLRADDASRGGKIREMIGQALPEAFLGYPTSPVAESAGFGSTTVITVHDFLWQFLAHDTGQPIAAADWLTFPSQELRAFAEGAVHFDDVGELTDWRAKLAYYPNDVWLYLLAAGWRRIAQEEPLMPRAGFVGDELGSAVIGSRLVRDVMSLGFLMERQYAPYPKWFGTAFGRLACSADLAPILWTAQRADNWQERQDALASAFERLAWMHNALAISERLPEAASSFHDRPFSVIHGDAYACAIVARISDPDVRRIAERRLIGSIDQFSDSTDLRAGRAWRPVLRGLYL